MKPWNLTLWKKFASFDTLLVPGSVKVVDFKTISKIVLFAMILRSNTHVCYKFSEKSYLLNKWKY